MKSEYTLFNFAPLPWKGLMSYNRIQQKLRSGIPVLLDGGIDAEVLADAGADFIFLLKQSFA